MPRCGGSARRRPLDPLHVRFTNTNGAITGLAVQNLGNTTTSYSGMLFYDQNGALGQFQGFNNVTHEYRINNIARTPAARNGSINFMTGSTSRFFVAHQRQHRHRHHHAVGDPRGQQCCREADSTANMWMTSYTNAVGPYYMARRARGTPAAPTAVQSGDGLAGSDGQGYGTTNLVRPLPEA